MGNYLAPEISHSSKIYRMVKNRNIKVLFTALAIFVFGILALYDGVIRPGAQTPVSIILVFIIIGISFYGFYLFLTRSQDIFRHPDVKKFLTFDNPRHYIDLFEQEVKDGSPKKFRDGFLTRSFIVSESFYRFRWAHSREITLAYVERSRLSIHRMPLPFLGISTVMVHLSNGTTLHINCGSKAEAELLLKMLTVMAPSARFGSAIYEKPHMPADYEAIAQDVADTIKQISYYKQPPVTPGNASRAERARVRPLSKEEHFDRQKKDLYDSLDKEDIARSINLIDTLGDNMNFAAADILEILLEYNEESVRVHAAFALGKLGQRSSVEPLIKALDDPSVRVRENAATALGKIGDQRAVAPLQQVSTADVRAKKAAVSALARIDQKLGIYNRRDGQTSFFHTAREKNP